MIRDEADGLGRWADVAVLFAAIVLIGYQLPRLPLEWQPALALVNPWRAFTAIGVHYTGMHLFANLAGLALTAALGIAARVPRRVSMAWLVSWPLTQAGLLLRPSLQHYGGLSGVLHAGVAAVIVYLLMTGNRAQRWVGAAAALGLVAKLALERPWGPVVQFNATWGMGVAPLVHTTGAIAGALCAAIALSLPSLGRVARRMPTAGSDTAYDDTLPV